MSKRPDSVYRENARRGAIKRQCPKCNRKVALSKSMYGDALPFIYTDRWCRWCDFKESICYNSETQSREITSNLDDTE